MTADQPGTDVGVVAEGFVSVTPISLDWTDRDALGGLANRLEHSK